MFIVGAIGYFCISPFYLHIFSSGSDNLIVSYQKIIGATDQSLNKTSFFLIASLFIGACIQGFSSVLWGIIRSKNYFKQNFILKIVGNSFQYIYQSPQIRNSISESEGKYPLPGSKDYAEMELFLSENVNRLEYLEWQRFLHFFYEYIGYVFLISTYHYAAYNICGIITIWYSKLIIFKFDLFYGIVFMIFHLIISIVFMRFGQEHRAAHRQALSSVWNEVSKAKVSILVNNEK